MANFIAIHHVDQTTAVVWARRMSNGLLTVVCNGATFTGETIVTTINDGCGICSITGLVAATSYQAQVYVAGVLIDTLTIKTLPATGSTFSIGFGTCFGHLRDQMPLHALLDGFSDLAGFAWLGDNIYADNPQNGTTYSNYGETIKGVAYDTPTDQTATMAQLYSHYRLYWSTPAYRRMMRSLPNWFIGDDHDHGPGNDWDHTIVAANTNNVWATTQLQIDNMSQWCNDAFRSYCRGNPNQPAFYYNVRVNDDCELIFIDGIQYRDASDGTGTTLMGAEQKAWFKATLAASTATWKIIMCGKNIYGGADDYNKYPTERAEIEDFIYAAVGWAKVGGVVWCSGDIHYPSARYRSDKPLLDVCASPAGTGTSTTVGDNYANYQTYKCTGTKSTGITDDVMYQSVGYIRAYGSTKLEAGLVDQFGNIRWRAYLLPGSNKINYDSNKISR